MLTDNTGGNYIGNVVCREISLYSSKVRQLSEATHNTTIVSFPDGVLVDCVRISINTQLHACVGISKGCKSLALTVY